MKTNKPEVVAYGIQIDHNASLDGVYLHRDEAEKYFYVEEIIDLIRLSDYEALQYELEMYKSAFNEWLEKSKWVQETAVPKELGMHRADVMKRRIEDLRAECEELRKELELWSPIHMEVERRAEKMHCLQDRCDFEVTVFYEDYAAIQGGQP